MKLKIIKGDNKLVCTGLVVVIWKLGGSSTYNDVIASMCYEREKEQKFMYGSIVEKMSESFANVIH